MSCFVVIIVLCMPAVASNVYIVFNKSQLFTGNVIKNDFAVYESVVLILYIGLCFCLCRDVFIVMMFMISAHAFLSEIFLITYPC